jgi:hypothetical protein
MGIPVSVSAPLGRRGNSRAESRPIVLAPRFETFNTVGRRGVADAGILTPAFVS